MVISIEDRVKGRLGKRLSYVRASLFEFENEIDYANPQGLELGFLNAKNGVIACDEDGYSLAWTDGVLDSFDMGGAGKRIVQDMSNLEPWARALNDVLVSAETLVDVPYQKIVGIELHFSNTQIQMVNLGDEIFVYEKIPEGSFGDSKIRRIKV
jgi:hypothetical protein